MKIFSSIAAAAFALLYIAGNIPPTEQYNLWLMAFIIPVALLVNIILIVYLSIRRRKSALLYLVALLVGGKYIVSTIGLKHFFKRTVPAENSFTVIDYNISSLNVQPYAKENLNEQVTELKDWIVNNDADIQCYQEFRRQPDDPDDNVLEQLSEKGFHYYFSPEMPDKEVTRSGVLIVSRFPIVNKGDVMASENGFNRVVYADIKLHEDTVRIVAVHLESMGLKGDHPAYAHSLSSGKRKTRIIFYKLKEGVFERSKQVRQLITFVEESPYPVVCAGDFNELPYSYSYQLMKRHLKNTFEEYGKGFGFTYNGKTLRTLRIDNQFYSSRIRPVSLETLRDVTFTDHFPVKGRYTLDNP